MKDFLNFLGKFSKKNYIIFILLGFLNSFIEILGISLLIPVFEILLNSGETTKYSFINQIITNYFHEDKILLIIIVCLMVIYFLKFLISILIVFVNSLITENIKIQIQKKVLKNYFLRPLLLNNEDSIPVQIRTITGETASALIVVETVLNIFIEATVLSFIFIFLFINFFEITLLTLVIFISLFLLYFLIFDKKIKTLGHQRISEEDSLYSKIYNSLNILKEIQFFNKQNFFYNKINENIYNLKKISIMNTLINGITRSSIEFFIIIIVCASLIYSKYFLNYNNTQIITSIGIFLAAIIRSFPSVTKIFFYHQKITFRKRSTEIINSLLSNLGEDFMQNKNREAFDFNQKITINNLSFKYKGRSELLSKINLSLHKNDCIGILGKNGSGKSTLLDIISGVIIPDTGTIKVDNKDIKSNINGWQENIIFLSQKNYLFEDTLLSNIVLGEENKDINKNKLKNTLKISNLEKFIESLPEGIETKLGSSNTRFSGGQQKKIQIARCFYQIDDYKKVIILDEPFENLDMETKSKFSNYVKDLKKDKLIIIISHTESDLEICNKLFDLEKNDLIAKRN